VATQDKGTEHRNSDNCSDPSCEMSG
ncbi:hypothetical protein CSUI_006376, partial [Cystoisospora suis]